MDSRLASDAAKFDGLAGDAAESRGAAVTGEETPSPRLVKPNGGGKPADAAPGEPSAASRRRFARFGWHLWVRLDRWRCLGW